MTDLSITRYAELQSLRSKFVLTQSLAACGTAHLSMLSAGNADFRLYELLKNDSRSMIEPAKALDALAASISRLLVEVNGIEPMTPCLQSRCSPS